jgi:type II secretory pathway pseudopilin PulG
MIEMMVVIAIIVLISVIAMPNISSFFQMSLNAVTRDLSTAIKEAYNSAAISGQVYRLVYDLKENSYWVESGPTDTLLDTKDSKEKQERRKRFGKESDKPPESKFTMDTTITRKKISLPRGVVFEDIVSQQSPDPITEGKAYSHFFPHGLAEQTIIHLKDDSKHHASLIITPLIGNCDLYDRYINAEEAFGK